MSKDEHSNDPKIQAYYSLRPFKFSNVEKLEIRQEWEDGGFATTYLDMVLQHVDPGDKRRLFLTFDNAVNIRLTPPMRTVLYMCQLEIRSIKDRQWDVKYKVIEVEDETLSLLCRDFTARIA